jgi:large subunit ribosomal protein L22
MDIVGEVFLDKCIVAPRKMRLVADSIRNENVDDALNILKYCPRKCSYYFKNMILSGIANVRRKCEKEGVETILNCNLSITSLVVNGDGMLKRILSASQGRAHSMKRRLSNVSMRIGVRDSKACKSGKRNGKVLNKNS